MAQYFDAYCADCHLHIYSFRLNECPKCGNECLEIKGTLHYQFKELTRAVTRLKTAIVNEFRDCMERVGKYGRRK